MKLPPLTPQELEALPEVLNLKEASRLLRSDTRVVARQVRTRKMPGKQLGAREYRFAKSALLSWLSGERPRRSGETP